MNHSVDFEYDVSEAPETVAVEFARECGYPAEEVAADVAEFLERVRRDVASRATTAPPAPAPPTTRRRRRRCASTSGRRGERSTSTRTGSAS